MTVAMLVGAHRVVDGPTEGRRDQATKKKLEMVRSNIVESRRHIRIDRMEASLDDLIV